MAWAEFDAAVGALCAWKEARGEGHDGMRAVLHVIDNRCKKQGRSWAKIVYAPLQFTSMTYKNDPELLIVPGLPDPQFEDAYNLALAIQQGQLEDITGGATNYFNPGVVLPSWAAAMTKTVTIGHHDFYK